MCIHLTLFTSWILPAGLSNRNVTRVETKNQKTLKLLNIIN